MRIFLEHLVMSASSATSLWLRSEKVELPAGEDPVEMGFSFLPNALSHSTSWRSEQEALVLTFAHVVSDGTDLEPAWSGSPEELEGLPSACHAVRHLHFLRFTDKEITTHPGLDDFWTFAHAVADQHYPAVAGLLFQHGLAGGPDFVI